MVGLVRLDVVMAGSESENHRRLVMRCGRGVEILLEEV